MDATEVKRLIAKGEGQFLEFKPGPTRPTELASSLAAFANADGGTLLLGVVERPDGEPWIEGVGNRKVTIDHLHTAAGLCSPKVELTPPEEINVDGRLVLAVTVPGGLRQVYSADGRYVVREGSYRRTLGAPEIRSLLGRRGLFVFDTQPVRGATRAHLDRALVRAYVGRYRSGRRMGADALLEARGLLVRPEGDPTASPVPSVAGVLLLGKAPQQSSRRPASPSCSMRGRRWARVSSSARSRARCRHNSTRPRHGLRATRCTPSSCAG